MELYVRSFRELTTDELYDIYKLRVAVFVVEQNCPYQEIDDADREAYHLFLKDEAGIAAYLRVLPPGVAGQDTAIGRVIAARRGRGLGKKILGEGIRVAREKFSARTIALAAQAYAVPFYEKLGFRPVSDLFLEDGIPHIRMIWQDGETQNPDTQATKGS